MTNRNELERLLAAAPRYDGSMEADGNVLWVPRGEQYCCGNPEGDHCCGIPVIGWQQEQIGQTGSDEEAALICFLRNNAQHYLSLMDEVEQLREALADANEALADIRQKPYAPWPDPDPEDTIGSMIDNQAWVMMSHIASFIGHRDGQPDLMEEWQDDWAENYHALFKGWFSPHRAAAKYIADRLTIRRQAAVEGAA